MEKIYAITYTGKQDDIIIYPTGKENEVVKRIYNRDGIMKKERVFKVTDQALINRRARDIQDYFYNMTELFGYVAHYE